MFMQILLSLRSQALAVTLSSFAGGEVLPLPRSKGGVFPSLLTLDGCPTASANVAQGQEDLHCTHRILGSNNSRLRLLGAKKSNR